MRIGFVPNAFHEEATGLLRELGDTLLARGHEVQVPANEARHAERQAWAVSEEGFGRGLDLVVVLGGDGTVLRAVGLTRNARVPLLAVNLGQLGYLAEVEPAGAAYAVEAFLERRHRLEHRMTVKGRVNEREFEGLNEIVLTGGEVGRLTDIVCSIDEAEFTVYRCDALLVATPTGSTAYALSAGGPIVSPGLDCLIVVPVAAHGLFNRALVLRPDEGLILSIEADRPASISVDGRKVDELLPGEALRLGAGAGVEFVRLDGLDFLGILREKFGLTTPGRR